MRTFALFFLTGALFLPQLSSPASSPGTHESLLGGRTSRLHTVEFTDQDEPMFTVPAGRGFTLTEIWGSGGGQGYVEVWIVSPVHGRQLLAKAILYGATNGGSTGGHENLWEGQYELGADDVLCIRSRNVGNEGASVGWSGLLE